MHKEMNPLFVEYLLNVTTKDILYYVDDRVSNVSHPPAVNQRVQ